MSTINDLIQDVYANFLSAYAHNTGSTNTVISFEAVGLSPGLDPSDPGSKAIALEYVSNAADWLPDLTNGTYERTMRTISVTYANLLNTLLPMPGDGVATFNAAKANAMESLDNFDLGSLNGPSTFKPAYASPQSWFDPAQAAGWSSYSYTAGKATTPGPQLPIRPPVWRMMSNAPAVLAPPASPPSEVPSGGGFQRETGVNTHHIQPFASPSIANPMRTEDTAAIFRPGTGTALPARVAVDSEVFHLDHLILNNSGSQPILQPAFSMSFQYVIVELQKPWYSGDLLANTDWYVPGQHAGDFATGSTVTPTSSGADPSDPSAPATAPAANTGFFAWIPVAFIAIKNLVIQATGGSLDPSVAQSVTSFGPFSLTPSTSTGALSNSGIEIIAWICRAQPQLPPQTDPALDPAPPSQSDQVTTTVDNVLNILGNLLGKKN